MITSDATSRPRRHLFVSGVARSGTTALARCLNRHRRVVLGIERFRHAFVDSSGETGCFGLFDKDRFFDFRPADRSAYVRPVPSPPSSRQVAQLEEGRFAPVPGWPERLYCDAREKYDDALYVGDKIPSFYRRARFLRERFPGCKMIFLLRNPVAVGMSWQMRADNTRDGWPHRNGFAEAIAEWNKALGATILAKIVLGGDLTVVLFEEMFAVHSLRRLLSRLDLDGAEMGDIRDLVKVWQRVVGQDARACPSQLRYAEEHVDHSTYEWFKKEAQV